MNRSKWNDERVQNILGHLLRIGVTIAALVVLCGGVLYLVHHGQARADFSVFNGEPSALRSLDGIFDSAFSFEEQGIIQLGLLLLIATPIARVLFSVFAFALERDRMYVVITLIVLSTLLYSLFS